MISVAGEPENAANDMLGDAFGSRADRVFETTVNSEELTAISLPGSFDSGFSKLFELVDVGETPLAFRTTKLGFVHTTDDVLCKG